MAPPASPAAPLSSAAPPRAFSPRLFAAELAIYAVFVTGYFLLVLHLLGDRLKHFFDVHRWLYAATALGLIVVQAVVLDAISRWLLRWLRERMRE